MATSPDTARQCPALFLSASAAALQDDDGPGFPPIAPLIVILGTIALAVYILTKDDDGDDLGLPLSPD